MSLIKNFTDEELEKLQKDAARYKWMRSNSAFLDRNGPGLYWYLPRFLSGDNGEMLDQNIDDQLSLNKRGI